MNREARIFSALPWWREALVYLAVLLAATVVFFLLHHVANQVPYDVAKTRVRQAFQNGDLNVAYRPYEHVRIRSTGALIGLDQFMECQVLLGVMAGADRSDSAETALSRALNPSYLRSSKHPNHFCQGLKAIAVDNDSFQRRNLKTRYWWGYSALYAILLKKFGVFEIRQFIQSIAYLSYLTLAVVLARLSGSVLLIMSPLIVFGVGLSAIPHFSTVTLGVAYAWAIASIAIVAWFQGRGASSQSVRIAAFCSGTVSAFVWFFDGHTMLAISLLAAAIYFLKRTTEGPLSSFRHALACTGSFVAGFVGSFAFGQIVKALYFGWDRVSASISSQAVRHVGNMGMENGQGLSVLPYFYEVTLLGGKLGLAFSILSMALGVVGVFALLYLAKRRRRAVQLIDALVPLILILVCYLYFLMGNDNVFVFARFAFLPHAFAWSLLLLAIVNLRSAERNT